MKLKLTLITLCFTSFLQAQKYNFGVKAGMNISSITNNVELEGRVGYSFGFFANQDVSETIAIQLELLVSQQGANSAIDSDLLDLVYVALPLMIKYYFVDSLYLEAGAQMSHEITSNSNSSFILDGTAIVRAFDFSANLGLGYNLIENIAVNARYNFGLRNNLIPLEAIVPNPRFNLQEGKNSVFTITVEYTFL